MLYACNSCGSRSTKLIASGNMVCRCGGAMEKQVFPWKMQCSDCGHIKTHETTPENFRTCQCWCHTDNTKRESLAPQSTSRGKSPEPKGGRDTKKKRRA